MKISIKHTCLIKLLLLLALVFIGKVSGAQNKMNDFSGTWVLNANKSDFGRLTVASASKMMTVIIKQLPNAINITTGDSTAHTEDFIKLDGTPSLRITNQIINEIPNIIKKPLTVQVINNRSFVEYVAEPGNAQSSNVRTYSISDDPQALTIDYKLTFSNSELTGKLVYEREK